MPATQPQPFKWIATVSQRRWLRHMIRNGDWTWVPDNVRTQLRERGLVEWYGGRWVVSDKGIQALAQKRPA